MIFRCLSIVVEPRHREAAGRGDPWLIKRRAGLPRCARNDGERAAVTGQALLKRLRLARGGVLQRGGPAR